MIRYTETDTVKLNRKEMTENVIETFLSVAQIPYYRTAATNVTISVSFEREHVSGKLTRTRIP